MAVYFNDSIVDLLYDYIQSFETEKNDSDKLADANQLIGALEMAINCCDIKFNNNNNNNDNINTTQLPYIVNYSGFNISPCSNNSDKQIEVTCATNNK